MRSVLCYELGLPPTLKLVESPDPTPGPGEIVISVEAAGVNYVDALFVAGRYQLKPALPFTPGSEIAGTVSAVGPGVDSVAAGDRVMAMPGLGGFATAVKLSEGAVTRIPEALDAPRAATFVQSYSTALFSLQERASIEPGEVVMVLGAGGGVGLAAIDVARALGATPIGAASTGEKRSAALEAGAAQTIDTSTEDLKERARELTDGRGVDVIVDPVGGSLSESALRALAYRGRYLVIGFASGAIPSIPLNQVLLRNRSVIGVDWGAWAMANAESQRSLLTRLFEMVTDNRLHPIAPVIYSLDRVAEALEDLVERRVIGKIALVP